MILRLIISAYLLNLRDCIHGLDVKTLFFCSVLPLLTSFCLNSKNGIKCSWHGTTSAYINSFVQVCVCVCVCVHVFAELCGPSHLKWSDLYFPNCLGARVQLMRKEWWKQAWPIANCCTYLIAVIWLCVASSGHDAAVGKGLHILYVVNPPYYCILAGVRGA